MGGGASKVSTEAHVRDKKVQQFLAREYKKERGKVKLLLLGTGNCGKSTFLKQFQLNFTETGVGDPAGFRGVVSANVLRGVRRAVELSVIRQKETGGEAEPLQPGTFELYEALRDNPNADLWQNVPIDDGSAQNVATVCRRIWADPAVQQSLEDRVRLIEEPVAYLMKHIKRIADPNYVPTTEDILHLRQRTSGARTVPVTLDKSVVEVVDVGGQKSERRKWASHFADVTGVLYIVSLGDFDCQMYEDNGTNRLVDALNNFEETVTSPYFASTNVILILNKKDVFYDKIRRKGGDLSAVFPEFSGPKGDYRAAVDYIRERFAAVYTRAKEHMRDIDRPRLQMFNAIGTDQSNVKVVFEACRAILVHEAMNAMHDESVRAKFQP